MFGGTRQMVRAESSPAGATVVASGGLSQGALGTGVDLTTPTALNLERKNSYVLTFPATGYTSQQVELQRSIRGGIVVLDVLAGLVGVIVDAATGAWYKLTPEFASVALTRIDPTVEGPDTISIRIDVKPADEKSKSNIEFETSAPGVSVTVQKQS